MAATPYADIYAEREMEVLADSGLNVENSRVVLRRCGRSIPQGQRQAVIREMLSVRYISDPWASVEGESNESARLPGLWRVSRVREAGPDEGGGIIQELRYGWMTPGSNAATWAAIDLEARITRVMDFATSGKTAYKPYFVVTYPNVATAQVKAFTEGIVPRGTLTNPTFDGQTQLSGSYKFVAARNEEQGDGSSIVQAVMVEATDATGMAVVYANNCGSLITNTIYSNIITPVTVTEGSSGIEYHVSSYNFDPSIGMYSMTITKTEQKTLTTGEFTVGDTQEATEVAQNFSGVRTGTLDHVGAAVPVWTPGNPSAGVEITQSISKNANCTTDINQKKRTVKELLSAAVRQVKDLFHIEVATTNKAQAAALDQPAEPADGVVQQTESVKNGLQQFDNTLRVTTERAVSNAVLSNQQTIFGTTAVAVAKSQPKATSLTASASAGTIVEKRGEKTPGDLLDVHTTTRVDTPVTAASVSNSQTIFESKVVQEDKAQPLATDLTPSASGGVVVSKSGQKTPSGLLDVSTDTKTETPVSSAKVSGSKTQFEQQAVVVDRSQPLATDLTPPAATGGAVVSKSGDKTPGGLLDVETRTNTELPVSSATRKTTQTLYEQQVVVVDQHQAAAAPDAAAPIGGAVETVDVSKTPGALFNNTKITSTENPVSDASVRYRKTAFETVADTSDRAQAAALAAPTTPGITAESAKTPGGLFNNSRSTVTPTPVSDAVHSSTATIDKIVASQTDRNQESAATPITAVPTGGVVQTVEDRLTPEAKHDHTTRTETEQPVASASVSTRKTAFETVVQTENRHQAADAAAPTTPGKAVENSKSPGGLVNQRITETTPTEVASAVRRTAATLDEITDAVTDRNEASAATPVTTVAAGGVVKTVEAQLTPEGRYDNTETTRTEQPVSEAVRRTTKTLFEEQVVVTDKNQSATAADAPEPIGGVVKAVAVSRTPGALFNHDTTTSTERPVKDASVRYRKTAFETVAETSDRSQSAPLDVPTTPGVTAESAKTPGGLFNHNRATVTPTAVSDAAHSSTATIDKIVASQTDRNQEAAATPVTTVPTTGVVRTVEDRLTPENKHDHVTRTETEQGVADAVVTKRLTAFESVLQTENRHQSGNAPDPSAPGQVVVNSKSPGGLVNQTITATTPTEVASAVRRTSSTIDEIVNAVTDRNESLAATPVTAAATGGVVKTVEAHLTPESKYDNTETTRTEQAVASATVRKSKTAFRETTETVNKHQASNAADPSAAGETVENSKSPGGLVNQSIRAETAVEVADAGTEKTVELLLTRAVTNKANQSTKETEPTVLTPGIIEQVVNRLNELNKWDTHKTTLTANYKTKTFVINGDNQTSTITVYHNITEADMDIALAALPGRARNSCHPGYNRFGLLDAVTVSTVRGSSSGTDDPDWTVTGSTYSTQEFRPRDGKMLQVVTTYTYDMARGTGVKHARSSHYSGAKEGSWFHSNLNSDVYEYLKVTAISTVTTDVTANWDGHVAIAG